MGAARAARVAVALAQCALALRTTTTGAGASSWGKSSWLASEPLWDGCRWAPWVGEGQHTGLRAGRQQRQRDCGGVRVPAGALGMSGFESGAARRRPAETQICAGVTHEGRAAAVAARSPGLGRSAAGKAEQRTAPRNTVAKQICVGMDGLSGARWQGGSSGSAMGKALQECSRYTWHAWLSMRLSARCVHLRSTQCTDCESENT